MQENSLGINFLQRALESADRTLEKPRHGGPLVDIPPLLTICYFFLNNLLLSSAERIRISAKHLRHKALGVGL